MFLDSRAGLTLQSCHPLKRQIHLWLKYQVSLAPWVENKAHTLTVILPEAETAELKAAAALTHHRRLHVALGTGIFLVSRSSGGL